MPVWKPSVIISCVVILIAAAIVLVSLLDVSAVRWNLTLRDILNWGRVRVVAASKVLVALLNILAMLVFTILGWLAYGLLRGRGRRAGLFGSWG